MPVQSSYPLVHTAATVGAVVDGQLKNVRSAVATVAIPFGRFVVGTATLGECKLPTATGDITGDVRMGVAIRVQDDVANGADVLQYEIGRNVSFVDFGVVWVMCDEAVTKGAPAFVRFTAGGQGQGSFGVTAGVGPDRATLSGGTFLAAASSGQLAPLRIRLLAGS